MTEEKRYRGQRGPGKRTEPRRGTVLVLSLKSDKKHLAPRIKTYAEAIGAIKPDKISRKSWK